MDSTGGAFVGTWPKSLSILLSPHFSPHRSTRALRNLLILMPNILTVWITKPLRIEESEIYMRLVSAVAIGLCSSSDASQIRLHCADKSARSDDVMASLLRLYDRQGMCAEFSPSLALPCVCVFPGFLFAPPGLRCNRQPTQTAFNLLLNPN